MMKQSLSFFAVCVGLLWASIASVDAQQNSNCTTLHVDSVPDGVIHFIEPLTGEIVHKDVVPYPFIIEHSPDCRWLMGYTNKRFKFSENCQSSVIIWSATSANRVVQLDDMCDTTITSYAQFRWKPDHTAAVISGGVGLRFLWYPDSNRLIEMNVEYNPYLLLSQLYWDDVRGLLWSNGRRGIGAYDLNSGIQVISLNHPFARRRLPVSSFIFSPNQTNIVAYGQSTGDNVTAPAMTVFDIATSERINLNVGLNAAGTVAMSPDNRYVGMAYTAIRIWDLQNLDEERLPNHRFYFSDSDIAEWSFIDNTTIEAVSETGDVMRWSLVDD
jgi:hypothetical protein